jgi:hypothetical protein
LLHITNGDLAADTLAGLRAGAVLPWRDVLHEGPVRLVLSLDELSRERAAFIAEAGWDSFDAVHAAFRERDTILRACSAEDEVVLWFEHDLYDQLQLLQLLDWFAAHPVRRLSLVCEAEYLGPMPLERMAELLPVRKPVTPRQLDIAEAAWLAFRSPHPAPLVEVLSQELAPLPHLRPALVRHLQEFPWTSDGLSRTERAILDALPATFGAIFERTREDPAFMGDTVLRWHLERLEREGWARRRGDQWESTAARGERKFPRWLGGVLVEPGSPWRWDEPTRRLSLE